MASAFKQFCCGEKKEMHRNKNSIKYHNMLANFSPYQTILNASEKKLKQHECDCNSLLKLIAVCEPESNENHTKNQSVTIGKHV